jgi:CRISPR/Cas system-associated endoribonuclease Cas2
MGALASFRLPAIQTFLISSGLRVQNSLLRGRCKQGKQREKGHKACIQVIMLPDLNADKPRMQELVVLQGKDAQRLQKLPVFIIPDGMLDPSGKLLVLFQLLMQAMLNGES